MHNYALNQKGKLVSAKSPSFLDDYICPVCKHSVELQLSQLKRNCFKYSDFCICNEKDLEQKFALLLLEQTLQEHIKEHSSLIFERNCAKCNEAAEAKFTKTLFNSYEIVQVTQNAMHINLKYMINNTVELIIADSNQLDILGETLLGHPTKFIVLSMSDFIVDPKHWKFIIENLKPFYCSSCKGS